MKIKFGLCVLCLLVPIVLSDWGCKEDATFLHDPATTIIFDLPQSSLVTLTIYDNVGSEVSKLLDREAMPVGTHAVVFNASLLASGVYYYQIIAESLNDDGTPTGEVFIGDKKMLLIK
jgi:hypothetical protein